MLELLKQSLPYFTALGGIGAFCFTIFKYLNSQKELVKNKRFEQFNKIFEWVAGRTADGNVLTNTQQVIAIYQLAEFQEYKHMSLPIIEYYLTKVENDSENTFLRDVLLSSKAKLSQR